MMNFDKGSNYTRSVSAPRSSRVTSAAWNPTAKVIETAMDARIKGKDRYVRNSSDILKTTNEGSVVPPIRGIRRSPARSAYSSFLPNENDTPRVTPGRRRVDPTPLTPTATSRTQSRRGLTPPPVSAYSTAAILDDCLSNGLKNAQHPASKYERGGVFAEKRHIATPAHDATNHVDRRGSIKHNPSHIPMFVTSPVQQNKPTPQQAILSTSRFRCRPAAPAAMRPKIDISYKVVPPYALS